MLNDFRRTDSENSQARHLGRISRLRKSRKLTLSTPLREQLTRSNLPVRIPLLSILLAAFALRTGVGFFSGLDWYTIDSYTYFEMADAILDGSPQSYFPNGYPLLIAAAQWLLPQAAVAPVLMGINVLLSTAVVGLTYRLTRSLHPTPAIALGAAAVLAVYPHQFVYLHYLLTEVATEFWIALGLVALCGRHFAGGAAALALATLFRSSLAPILPVVFIVLWLGPDRGRRSLRFASGLAAVLLVYSGLLAADIVAPTRNLAGNLHAAVSQPSTGFVWNEVTDLTREQIEHPIRSYLEFAMNQPGRFAVQRLSALWETWGPWPGDSPRAVWEAVLIGLRFPLLVLALMAFVRHRARLEFQLLLVPIGVVTIVHISFFSAARFSTVVMPLVVAMAAVTLGERILFQRGTRPGDSTPPDPS